MSENLKIALSVLQTLGSLATVGSLVWAVRTYRKEKAREFLEKQEREHQIFKKELSDIPQQFKHLIQLISEPIFAVIGHSIAEELKTLKPKNQSIDDFAKFLLNPDSSNYIALASYMGHKKCQEITMITDLTNSIAESNRKISINFMFISSIIRRLSHYIITPSQRITSIGFVFSRLRPIDEDGDDNEVFREFIKSALKTGTEELFFKELAIYIVNGYATLLKRNALGKRTIDLSLKMIDIIAYRISLLSSSDILRLREENSNLIEKHKNTDCEHSVQDAVAMLRDVKHLFDEGEWDKLVECNGGIIEFMNDGNN